MDGAVGMVRVTIIPQSGEQPPSMPASDVLGLVRFEEVNGERYIDLTTTRELPH